VLHRRSWRLPLTGGPVATGDVEGLDPLLGLDALGPGAVPGPVVTSRD
jgi:hypothetical protein